ncbi:MAG TPA: hypothetical protein DEQ09_10525 [Bacteroidales bacterium]|nr:hypothetical protein [Bacteroidales bacterium]
MKKFLSLILAVMLTAGFTYSQEKENRDVADFTGVAFGVAGKLILEQGNNFRVTLEGDKDYLDKIETIIRGDRLVIRHERWYSFGINKKVTVYVIMPEIEDLTVSGSGMLIAEGAIRTDDLDINVSGSGNIELADLNAESVDCSISGSGSIELNGEAEEGEVSISGSGNYDGRDFKINSMDVSISGSGTCRALVNEDLEARISGSGDIYYDGSPRVDARVSGSGKVRKN